MEDKTEIDYWCLVQHSGFAHSGNNQFRRAVEHVHCTPAAALRVRNAGGVLFGEYMHGYRAAFAANYPPEVKAFIPRCRGRFVKVEVGYLKVYIPAESEQFDGVLQGQDLLDLD